MGRHVHRPRRQISADRVRWLRLLGFRYSAGRDAYVLRGVGNQLGPVYRVEHAPRQAASAVPSETQQVS